MLGVVVRGSVHVTGTRWYRTHVAGVGGRIEASMRGGVRAGGGGSYATGTMTMMMMRARTHAEGRVQRRVALHV